MRKLFLLILITILFVLNSCNFSKSNAESEINQNDTEEPEANKILSTSEINEKILNQYNSPMFIREIDSYNENGVIEKLTLRDKSTNDPYSLLKGLNNWTSISFYKNGQLHNFHQCTGSKKDGEYTDYFENGIKQIEAYYTDGQLDKKYTQSFEDGKVFLSMEYKNGRLVGESVSYFPNGKIREKMLRDENGIPIGKKISYFENGKISSEISYNEIGKNSSIIWYNQKGEKEKEEFFNDEGKISDTIKNNGVTTFDENGNVIK